MKLDCIKICGRNAKSPVLVAGVPSLPVSLAFSPPTPSPFTPATQASRSAATRGRAETNQQEQLNEGIQCFMCFLNLARFVFAFSLHRNLILRVSSVFLVFVRLVCSLGIAFRIPGHLFACH